MREVSYRTPDSAKFFCNDLIRCCSIHSIIWSMLVIPGSEIRGWLTLIFYTFFPGLKLATVTSSEKNAHTHPSRAAIILLMFVVDIQYDNINTKKVELTPYNIMIISSYRLCIIQTELQQRLSVSKITKILYA